MKVYPIPLLVLIVDPVFAIEKLECGGTEPFWSAVFADQQITFELSGTSNRTYSKPTYVPAAGASSNYVMSVQASGKTGRVTGFIVNETLMVLMDKRGKAPEERLTFKAYCSDGMSERAFPFSIHLVVDGKPYTGCCASASNRFIEPKE
jgi:uncharacterized membrane protein